MHFLKKEKVNMGDFEVKDSRVVIFKSLRETSWENKITKSSVQIGIKVSLWCNVSCW